MIYFCPAMRRREGSFGSLVSRYVRLAVDRPCFSSLPLLLLQLVVPAAVSVGDLLCSPAADSEKEIRRDSFPREKPLKSYFGH